MSKECVHCRADNDDSAAECENCGGKSFTAETSAGLESDQSSHTAKEFELAPILVMTDLNKKSGKVIKINDSCTIGRKGDIETEFFAEDMYISEYHCKVISEKGEYKIEHIGRNPTKINNVELSKGVRTLIRNGDHLKIADKTFEISICRNAVSSEAIPGTITPADNKLVNETKYIIICPKCGHVYEVQNIDDRKMECNNCDDYDKYEISKVRAKVTYAN